MQHLSIFPSILNEDVLDNDGKEKNKTEDNGREGLFPSLVLQEDFLFFIFFNFLIGKNMKVIYKRCILTYCKQ